MHAAMEILELAGGFFGLSIATLIFMAEAIDRDAVVADADDAMSVAEDLFGYERH
jgi:hypothetical protein